MPVGKRNVIGDSLGISRELWLQGVAEKAEAFVHFSREECLSLLKMYQRLDDREKMDRLLFRNIMFSAFQITDSFMLDRIFRMADKTGSGYIEHLEWIGLLSVLMRGTFEEQIEFCYNVYDINGDRALSTDELYMMLGDTFKARGEMDEAEAHECVKELVQLTMKKLDLDRDGLVSFVDYKSAVEREPLLLQCCGICLPSPQSLKAFQYIFTQDYKNHTTDRYVSPKSYSKSANPNKHSVGRRVLHRKITDVNLPPPPASSRNISNRASTAELRIRSSVNKNMLAILNLN
jgi:Ca2+-binding EF-hand superfamily protein